MPAVAVVSAAEPLPRAPARARLDADVESFALQLQQLEAAGWALLTKARPGNSLTTTRVCFGATKSCSAWLISQISCCMVDLTDLTLTPDRPAVFVLS